MNETIVILGTGPAGSRAALRLAAAGLKPIVIDEQEASGGQIYRRPAPQLKRDYREVYGTEHEKARALHDDFDAAVAAGKIDYRPRTTAWAVHENYVYADHDGTTSQIDYARLLIATGAVERIIPITNWTLPGLFTLGGAQIALKAQGCSIGQRVAFAGTGPLLYLVALQYAEAGAEIAGLFDTSTRLRRLSGAFGMLARPRLLWIGIRMVLKLKYRHRIRMASGVRPEAVLGSSAVEGLRVGHVNGRTEDITCSAIGIGFDLRPETQLADLAGCEIVYDENSRNWRPHTDAMGRTSKADVYVAGDAAGIAGADAAELGGRLAAEAILADMNAGAADNSAALSEHRAFLRFRKAINTAFPAPVADLRQLADDTMLCRCEGITVKTFRETVSTMEVKEINRAKSMTRCGMGRCQGRFCEFAAAELLSQILKVDRAAVGRLRTQPPVKPIAPMKTRNPDGNR